MNASIYNSNYLKVFMVLTLTLASVVIAFLTPQKAYADAKGITQEDMEIANALEDHLVFEDSGVSLIDEATLDVKLANIGTDISIADLKADIENAKVELNNQNEDGITTYASACSIALGAMGLYNNISMSAAMLILGVTMTPALLAITAVTGAVWYGGALLCP